MVDVVQPPRVRAGDRVRLVSPVSFPSEEVLAESVRALESWGLVVDVGKHAMDRHGYLAGRDEDRLADLDDAYRDPGVRAVVATTGGGGAYRIADDLDFAAVRADPEPLVGFSDITNLHLALWRHCRVAGIHGFLAGAIGVPGGSAGSRARARRPAADATHPIGLAARGAWGRARPVPGVRELHRSRVDLGRRAAGPAGDLGGAGDPLNTAADRQPHNCQLRGVWGVVPPT